MPLESFTNNINMAGLSAELMLCMLRPGNSIPPLNNPLYWELLRVGLMGVAGSRSCPASRQIFTIHSVCPTVKSEHLSCVCARHGRFIKHFRIEFHERFLFSNF